MNFQFSPSIHRPPFGIVLPVGGRVEHDRFLLAFTHCIEAVGYVLALFTMPVVEGGGRCCGRVHRIEPIAVLPKPPSTG